MPVETFSEFLDAAGQCTVFSGAKPKSDSVDLQLNRPTVATSSHRRGIHSSSPLVECCGTCL